MSNFELIDFDTPGALAKDVAERLLGFVSGRQKTILCLSGGRITVALFRELRTRSENNNDAGRREFVDSTDFFWADERCVPASDPESNYGIAQQDLFAPLNIAPERIHRIPGEADPVFAAQMAEAELCRIAPLNDEGIPVIDLLLLGMGEDGHVASLFPGHAVDEKWIDAIYRPVTGPKPPPRRITLSHRAVAAAKEVWVLVSGEGKEEAFRRALAGDKAIPLGRVLNERTDTLIFSDLNRL